MSSFSDDDLKRLKKDLEQFDDGWNCQECGLNQTTDFKALLARLEAAEECIGFNSRHSEWESRYDAWRKAAGRMA